MPAAGGETLRLVRASWGSWFHCGIEGLGYFAIGWSPFTWDWGISWAYGHNRSAWSGESRFLHHGSVTLMTREEWDDFGLWALWPIHEIRMPARALHRYSSIRWTGRNSRLEGWYMRYAGFHHVWRLPRWLKRLAA